jgi:hypothetical protein
MVRRSNNQRGVAVSWLLKTEAIIYGNAQLNLYCRHRLRRRLGI